MKLNKACSVSKSWLTKSLRKSQCYNVCHGNGVNARHCTASHISHKLKNVTAENHHDPITNGVYKELVKCVFTTVSSCGMPV